MVLAEELQVPGLCLRLLLVITVRKCTPARLLLYKLEVHF